MPANWTAPRTWANNELVDANLMNTQLRDNLEFLKKPPTGLTVLNEGANLTTTSTTWVDVDGAGTQLQQTIQVAGGDVLIGFWGNITHGTSARIFLDVEIAGPAGFGTVRLSSRNGGSGDGICEVFNTGSQASFVAMAKDLPAGSYTFKLQWRISSATTATFQLSSTDKHNPQFWVREV